LNYTIVEIQKTHHVNSLTCTISHSVVSILGPYRNGSRLSTRNVFNSSGPTTSTCKRNTNKLKYVTNKMYVKSAINAQLKKNLSLDSSTIFKTLQHSRLLTKNLYQPAKSFKKFC